MTRLPNGCHVAGVVGVSAVRLDNGERDLAALGKHHLPSLVLLHKGQLIISNPALENLLSYWNRLLKGLSHEIDINNLDKNLQCSARDWDRIRITWGNPQSGCSDICSYLMGHCRCTRARLCDQAKLRYEASQVWMNATFISQGPQSSV